MPIFGSEIVLLDFLGNLHDQNLSEYQITETRSVLEGAKALVRGSRRFVSDPAQQKLARALSRLEEEIATFDARQRQVALTALGGPQRIRGLAGSGTTVIEGLAAHHRRGTAFCSVEARDETAIRLAPEMRFVMPDPRTIELIQRDLSECALLLGPLAFCMMIARLYYPDRWLSRSSFEGALEAGCLDLRFSEVIQGSQVVPKFTDAERRTLHLGRNMEPIDKAPEPKVRRERRQRR